MKQIALRLDDDMHRALTEQAKIEHRSLHAHVLHILVAHLRRTRPSPAGGAK